MFDWEYCLQKSNSLSIFEGNYICIVVNINNVELLITVFHLIFNYIKYTVM
jgi:hypothetical protein